MPAESHAESITFSTRLLVAEDERSVVDIVSAYLLRSGYAVLTALDGLEALRLTYEQQPALLILDLMLPGMDGFSICQTLRATGNLTPILALTARISEQDKLRAFELGFDDYVTKPFSPRELVARVRAVLRRHVDSITRPPTRVVIGDLVIDLVVNQVSRRGQLIHLSPCEWGLLEAMAQNPGRVFTRQELLAHLIGLNHPSAEASLDTHIMNIRRHIEPNTSQPCYIKNVHGVGYKLGENTRD
jgi:two-component system, OmpR family, alkaline phosphatase synthesis response regulator PhoP